MAQGKKTGGRQQGTPNKITKSVREMLEGILNDELEGIYKHLKAVGPKDRLNFIVRILPYLLPRYQTVTFLDSSQDSKQNNYTSYLQKQIDGFMKSMVSSEEMD